MENIAAEAAGAASRRSVRSSRDDLHFDKDNRGIKLMNRTVAREAALCCVFGLSFGERPVEAIEQRISDEGLELLGEQSGLYSGAPDEKNAEYIRTVALGVSGKLDELDAYIAKYATGWNVRRISRVCKAVMRLCIYEILYLPDIPAKVSINEAVELTRKYENEEITAFLNGVLGGFMRGEKIEK